MAAGSGVIIAETECHLALMSWVLNWTEFGECKVTPVLDDQDAKAALDGRCGQSIKN